MRSGFSPFSNSLKTYDHVQIGEIDGHRLIRKPISPVETEFFSAGNELGITSIMVTPRDIRSDQAYYEYLDGGDIIGAPIAVWRECAKTVAILSSTTPTLPTLIPTATRQQYVDRISTVYHLSSKHGASMNRASLQFMKKHTGSLIFDAYCHDDLIALNVLRDGHKTRIIDWEHIRIDFREKDIGRLLGDLYFDTPAPGKYYYPTTWREELIDLYLDETKHNVPDYNTTLARTNLSFAMLWNYLGPIHSVLKSGVNLDSDWFSANIKEFNAVKTAL